MRICQPPVVFSIPLFLVDSFVIDSFKLEGYSIFFLAASDVFENLMLFIDQRFKPSRSHNNYEHINTNQEILKIQEVKMKGQTDNSTVMSGNSSSLLSVLGRMARHDQ